MRIGYLSNQFPGLSTTFIYREVTGLMELGTDIKTFSIWKPKEKDLSEESKHFLRSTFYILPIVYFELIKAHFKYLRKNHSGYIKALKICIFSKHKNLKNRTRTFFHFLEAVYLSDRIVADGIDHIHTHFAGNATTITMIVSMLTGISYSFTAHAKDIFVNPILLKEKVEYAKFIVAISEYNKTFIVKATQQPNISKKIHVVRCGIDSTCFMPTKGNSSFTEHLTILSIGRLVKKKGISYLIQACGHLKDCGVPFRCNIIGSGPEMETLKQQIIKERLEEHVYLLGTVYQENILSYFSESDLFVLPCVVTKDHDMDGIPVAIMEAMSMRLPVISTTISGIPELIKNEISGLLVPQKNATALCKAIHRLAQNKDFCIYLGENGRKKIIAEFDTEKNTKKLLRLFREYS